MSAAGFWDKPQEAKALFAEMNPIKGIVGSAKEMQKRLADFDALVELVEEGSESDVQEYLPEILETLEALKSDFDRLEIESFLSGPIDH